MAVDESEIDFLPSEKSDDWVIFGIEEQQALNLTAKIITSSLSSAREELKAYVASENFMVFKHGPDLKTDIIERSGEVSRNHSEFKKSSVEISCSMDALRTADFNAIEVLRDQLRDGFRDNTIASLFGAMTEATAGQPSTNLEISGDIRPGLIDALKNISISLEDNLQPIYPDICLPDIFRDKFIKKIEDLEKEDPEFLEQYGLLKRRKWLEALIKHFENLLKFQLSDYERSTIIDWLQRIRATKESLLLREGCESNQGEFNSG